MSRILFSQTREDPNVELYGLSKISKNEPNILMVASGGCTLLSLLKNKCNIDAIDININQIHLCKLKYALTKFLPKNKYISYIQGTYAKENILKYLNVNEESYEYWLKNQHYIYNGINNCGVYEKLFALLSNNMFDDMIYERLFSTEFLRKLFGKNAVKNTKKFDCHFRSRLNKLFKTHNNYFKDQILYGRYFNFYPPYIESYDEPYLGNVNYINDNIIQYINNTEKKYDMIHLSNITDWMDSSEIEALFYSCIDKLNSKGIITVRRLNGNYELKKIVDSIENLSYIEYDDKSCIYNECIVITYENLE